MKDVMKKQRQARRKIIRQWTMLPRDKRQSDQIAAFAKTAARENENAFVHSRRDPHEKIIAVRTATVEPRLYHLESNDVFKIAHIAELILHQLLHPSF